MSDIVESSKCNLTENQQLTTTHTPASFLSLPTELRNMIYELVLLHEEPIALFIDWSPQEFTPGLLRANKVFYREASSLFYAQNRFDLTNGTAEAVASFFEDIGSDNAACIRHICVDFPDFLCLYPGNVILQRDSVGILANIKSSCANLSTLTTSRGSTNSMEHWLDGTDNLKVVTEALELVDARFRDISSLQEIIVEVYDDEPSGYIRQIMESQGWTISKPKYVLENWNTSFIRGFGHGGYSPDYDSGGDYNLYDIEEDDSDYWRRADRFHRM